MNIDCSRPLIVISYYCAITEFNTMREPMQEEESQEQAQYRRTSFEHSDRQMSIKTLTHDHYILELPQDPLHPFYKQFGFYLEELDFRGKRIEIAPVARIYGTN